MICPTGPPNRWVETLEGRKGGRKEERKGYQWYLKYKNIFIYIYIYKIYIEKDGSLGHRHRVTGSTALVVLPLENPERQENEPYQLVLLCLLM